MAQSKNAGNQPTQNLKGTNEIKVDKVPEKNS